MDKHSTTEQQLADGTTDEGRTVTLFSRSSARGTYYAVEVIPGASRAPGEPQRSETHHYSEADTWAAFGRAFAHPAPLEGAAAQ